jgi:hypothetical protein
LRRVDHMRLECVDVADTGVVDVGAKGTGADGKMGGTYVDCDVNMLGHWGIIRGCSGSAVPGKGNVGVNGGGMAWVYSGPVASGV